MCFCFGRTPWNNLLIEDEFPPLNYLAWSNMHLQFSMAKLVRGINGSMWLRTEFNSIVSLPEHLREENKNHQQAKKKKNTFAFALNSQWWFTWMTIAPRGCTLQNIWWVCSADSSKLLPCSWPTFDTLSQTKQTKLDDLYNLFLDKRNPATLTQIA